MAEEKEPSAEELSARLAEYLKMARGMEFSWLGLADRELTKIPGEVFTWTSLRQLDLSGNHLRSIRQIDL